MRLSIGCLGTIKISLKIIILKLVRELYNVRIHTDIIFLLIRVKCFLLVSDFIFLVVSNDLSYSCFGKKLFTFTFSCCRLITLESNFSSLYTCNSLIELISCVFRKILISCVF